MDPAHLAYQVMIHATADIPAAEAYGAQFVGIDTTAPQKTTIKKHNPKTVRKNVGEGHLGLPRAASWFGYGRAQSCTVASKAGGTA
ncbi:hypothetical protein [Streptomyces sp. NPDC014733]|uniref:hypothetical protein n=1 Tax=Streptomyces sp. NPDC014733 TaxID=3364885 RepID=UPI0036FCA0F2